MGPEAEVDLADPAAQAAKRAHASETREHRLRIAAGVALAALAAIAPFVASPLTGDPGAVVGAAVAALLLAGLAVAVWPYERSAAERKHRELEAIWRELRSDAGAVVPWERHAAWAEPDGRHVKLSVITCGPRPGEGPAAASPYSRRALRRLPAEDLEPAAEAMEKLRADASRRELDARRRHEQQQVDAEWAAHELTLQEIEQRAAAELAASER